MRKLITLAAMAAMTIGLTACGINDAAVVSENLSQAADNFQIARRVVFYNGITNEYILTIEGFCSLDASKTFTGIAVTCKTGPNDYKKHFLALSDNVTVFAEQIDAANVSASFYKVTFKPSVIIPEINIR